MAFLDGVIIPVPEANRDGYTDMAKTMADVFIDYGALEVVDAWGTDIPDGEVTSYPMAVKRQEGETVVFGWVTWPDKDTRDNAWPKIMEDSRMADFASDLFDGQRMILGGFEIIQSKRKGG